MSTKKLIGFIIIFLFSCAFVWGGQDKKPNFSGLWVLDTKRSDLNYASLSANQPVSGGKGTEIGGGESGRSRLGGRRGGGAGMVGGGMGRSTSRSSNSGAGLKEIPVIDSFGVVADKLTIVQSDPTVTIQQDFEMGDGEKTHKFDFTTDGKSTRNVFQDGTAIQSKTYWAGPQLVTKSKVKTPMGFMEVDETRSLSADGSTLTIKIKTKEGSSNWAGKAVYTKGNNNVKDLENNK